MSKKPTEVWPIRITYELDTGETISLHKPTWIGMYLTEARLLEEYGKHLRSMTITKTFEVPVLEEAPAEVAGEEASE